MRFLRSACCNGNFGGGAQHSARLVLTWRLQVDYATGELDRLRVLGPIDTKLFIGSIHILLALSVERYILRIV